MSVSSTTAGRRASTAVRVSAYVLLAYTVSWICWLPLVFSHQIVHVGGWPTHLPGLLGPAAAAVVVTCMATGRAGARDLLARLTRWRIGWWWLVALSPLALLGLGLAGATAVGQSLPRWGDFGRINGFPTWGPLTVLALLIVVNGLGEETGWRGFLQPTLQRVLPPRLAILAVAVVWAGWHAPLFAILTTYRGFTPLTLVGFGIGLTCGAVVLGWLYNRTGSILAVAVWHATYNVTAATDAAHGLIAAVSTTAVIIAATSLIIADVATHGQVLTAARASPRPLTPQAA
ncbi:MAG: protease family protein [Actinoplanes sp.]|nr:protease family protein [Actinoplanes sp.]